MLGEYSNHPSLKWVVGGSPMSTLPFQGTFVHSWISLRAPVSLAAREADSTLMDEV